MKGKNDIVKTWIKKAENDLITAKHSINIKPKPPFDTICFHAQQCAEKYIKAFLTFHNVEFKKTHDLGEFILLASIIDESFSEIVDIGEKLTDYAVDIRYPMLLEEPAMDEAKEAVEMAEKIKEFVLKKLHLKGENND